MITKVFTIVSIFAFYIQSEAPDQLVCRYRNTSHGFIP